MKNTVRLNFEFPKEHYPYLKMLCAIKSKSLKDFASEVLIKEIEEYEDLELAKVAEIRLKEMETDGYELIDFEDAIKLAGWSNEQKI